MQGPIQLPPPPPLRPRSVGEILEAAFSLYGRYWRTLLALVAVVVVPLTILQYLVADAIVGSTVTRDGQIVVTGSSGRAWGSGFLLGVLALLIQQILIGALAWAVASTLIGREPDIGESYRFGYRRLWSILLVGILFALAVFAGLIALVIPGIIIAVRLSVAIPALVVEGKRGTAALGRSWDLVRGRSWSVFGAFIIAAFLTAIVNAALTSIAGSGWFANGVLAAIASVITTPFMGLVIGLLYFDLRVRKEQFDVATLERELQAASSM